MKTDRERTGVDPDRAVEEAERVRDRGVPKSAPTRAPRAGDGFLLLFAAMMALCVVIVAVFFAGLALGASLGVLVIVLAAAVFWFAHARLMGRGHRH